MYILINLFIKKLIYLNIMNIVLTDSVKNFWIDSNRYSSFQSFNKFINYFFPENLEVLSNNNLLSELVIYDIQLEDNSIIDLNKINIIISVENCYNFDHYKHFNKYKDFNNNKIQIYFYNHINKLILNDKYIVIPVIYTQINYLNNYYNNIKPSVIIPFENKKFCIFVSNNYYRHDIKHKIREILKEIGECDFIESFKYLIENKSCYHSDELINLFQQYKFVFVCENSILDGYITEKIFNCFFSRSIPLYNGCLEIENYINKNSFINLNDIDNTIIDQISLLNSNENLFNKMINENKINNNFYDENYKTKLKDFIHNYDKKLNNKFVSIITIANDNFELLKILYDNINNQNYKYIKEWIIVCDNNYIHPELINKNFIIKYVKTNINQSIGTLKNIANNKVSSNYIVLMNDDDYYPPSYIDNCINKLNNKLLLCSKNIYLHDFILNKTFKTSCFKYVLAYKKEYLINHTFNDSNDNIDEFFTNNFTVDMEELLSDNSLVKFIHTNNKFFKNEVLIASTISNDGRISLPNGQIINLSDITKLQNNIIDIIIQNNYYSKYLSVFNLDNNIIDYDIVYLTGGFSIIWDPSDQKLGGSEQAVVQLSENWIKLNKKVAVYGNFSQDIIVNGVDYIHFSKFPFNKKFKTLISWRRHGLILLMYNEVIVDNLILDFHDNFSYTLADLDSHLMEKIFKKSNKFNFKSTFHQECFIDFIKSKNINELSLDKYNIIPNGLRILPFLNNKILNNNEALVRNPYRFCYCSSYDRGLETILEKIWPVIYNNQPLAELHIYYGMDYIFDDNFKNKMKKLFSQSGVMDHGRQPMELIIREKYLSTFHLYINNSIAEIDCISIKESLITGCIPIISNFGVFKERHGIQFNWDPNNNELCQQVANNIIIHMHNFDNINNIRNNIKKSNLIIDWFDIAKLWLNNIN